jgi:hypothetical protein
MPLCHWHLQERRLIAFEFSSYDAMLADTVCALLPLFREYRIDFAYPGRAHADFGVLSQPHVARASGK